MLKLPKGTLRRGVALPAHKTSEIERFGEQFEALDSVKRTRKAALMERKEADGRSLTRCSTMPMRRAMRKSSPGQNVMFAITDTGKGMDAATAMRALDPFLTTKPAGEGTGLGLPQVYCFVKQSGGHLNIYSEAGEGTTIKLYFPRDLDQESFQPRQVAALAVTATEKVLLVDDDEIVRATVASMLESLGYEVITAASGAEAISILEKGTAIELLFTDIIMPGAVSGRKLAERAAEIKPAIKVLFTSSYAENSIVHNGRLDPGVEFLSKPYDRERLAMTVRRMLDGPAKNIEDPERTGAGDQAPSNALSSADK